MLLRQLVAGLTRGIREGSPAAAIVDAVKECGRILQPIFPPDEQDVNELENFIDNSEGSSGI